ncbi:translesion error-prone DNA polymerase V autoproteolytic subunit [Crenobacter sp. SG2305]|uniref:LexA family protein n=1 Tax=Crenobacter oryzisoli TaxID=3056844 RepID=UPI0025AB30E1|nr:translesion error-prone DNA polymerase V autoproteolytic subunit [Crenobacter sp. SG2305]MDN0081654.1 translesion error-prone DNA polymerase V autoproteolytic subunit [Crenobacter sp. SG2305]
MRRKTRAGIDTPSPAELAERFPGRILLPADDATPASVPLYAEGVRAGHPSPVGDYAYTPIDLNTYLVEDGLATFMVLVEGDAMVGAGLYEGDLLVTDTSRVPVHGDIVVAALDGDFTVRRLHRTSGQIALHAENPAYPVIVPRYEQDFAIWGVVSGCVKKF